MNTSLDIQGRLSGGLPSAQARSACLFFLVLLLFYSLGASAHGAALLLSSGISAFRRPTR